MQTRTRTIRIIEWPEGWGIIGPARAGGATEVHRRATAAAAYAYVVRQDKAVAHAAPEAAVVTVIEWHTSTATGRAAAIVLG
jgi:hypothetical protein